jgi:hypothetical protein
MAVTGRVFSAHPPGPSMMRFQKSPLFSLDQIFGVGVRLAIPGRADEKKMVYFLLKTCGGNVGQNSFLVSDLPPR